MAEIPLTRGMVALVDDEDVPLLAGYKWHATWSDKWYARAMLPREEGRKKTVFMHRLLMPGVRQVDHKNGDGLDNRRSNLRPATSSQNGGNRAKLSKVTTSAYKGVSIAARLRPTWQAAIKFGDRSKHLGYFPTEAAAAFAYNEAARAQWGEYAKLNVIEATP